MGPLGNAQRLQALRAATATMQTRIGLVTAYDPTTYMARVQLQPEGLFSGWLPVATPWAGDGWGMFCPPGIGDQIQIEYVDGDLNGGIALARFFSDAAQPMQVESGEFWLVHAKGQLLKLTNDGKLTLSDGQGATLTLNGDGTVTTQGQQWTHTGAMNLNGATIDTNGNIQSPGTVTGAVDVVAAGISGKGHIHSNGNDGSPTGPPIPG